MTVKDFSFLKIKLFDGDNIVYEGMCEDTPEEFKNKDIKIEYIESKILYVKIIS